MAKQSVIKRVVSLFRANAHSALDNFEGSQAQLEQTVRDFAENTRKLENSVAEAIGNVRIAEQDQEKDIARYKELGEKVQQCIERGTAASSKGDTETADKMDRLSRRILTEQVELETRIRANHASIQSQKEAVEGLMATLDQTKADYRKLVRKKDDLVARNNTAEAVGKIHELVGSINNTDPTSELGRIEAAIRQKEAKVLGHEALASKSIDSELAELDRSEAELTVDARLAALKNGTAPTLQLVSGDK